MLLSPSDELWLHTQAGLGSWGGVGGHSPNEQRLFLRWKTAADAQEPELIPTSGGSFGRGTQTMTIICDSVH